MLETGKRNALTCEEVVLMLISDVDGIPAEEQLRLPDEWHITMISDINFMYDDAFISLF